MRPLFGRDTIVRARQANLAAYLIARGERLIKNGRRYHHSDHDSLVFTDNAYFWNSRGEKGNAIDFLVRFYGMSFREAVDELAGGASIGGNDTLPEVFDFSKYSLTGDKKRLFAFLTKTRGISVEVVVEFCERGMLFIEDKTNNLIFPICDELGGVVGAEFCGTLSDKRFKGVAAGSRYGYGFNICFGEELSYMLFFESPLDLMAFVSVKRISGKSLDGCMLVSMAGLKENVVKTMLEAQKGLLQPVICVDNDNAGQAFINRLKRQNLAFLERRPEVLYKDWNDQLLSRPMV